MESSISESTKSKQYNNVCIIYLYEFALSYKNELNNYLAKYGITILDVFCSENKDAKLLYKHFVLKSILDFIKENNKNCGIVKYGFLIKRNDLTALDKEIINILEKVFKFSVYITDPSDSDIYAEKILIHRAQNNNRNVSLQQVRRQLKKAGLTFLSTQYFNDYNAKFLLSK